MKNNIKLLLAGVMLCSANVNAQVNYRHDRVYTADQVSNTVSVVDPSDNKLLGVIKLGNAYPGVLGPLYRGQSLVHGMRYSEAKKMLAVVAIGSNSVTLISTETNKILKTIYIGRSPHEPTFTPDSKQIWTSVRGEAYISVIDVNLMKEIKHIAVADGPGMVTFTTDGKQAYICSSFTPEVDIVSTATYQVTKRIKVTSPFSPNIYTSPDGRWIAMTHKDVGKVTVISTKTQAVTTVLNTGPISNHVTFCYIRKKLMMLVTIGGENKVRFFDVAANFKQTDTVMVGAIPHGLWPSKDGKLLYVGLEYADEVQGINLETMKALPPIAIGQSPQALVYADNAVTDADNRSGLSPLNNTTPTQILILKHADGSGSIGRLALRNIGLIDLLEQQFTGLKPGTSYTLALSRSNKKPYNADYEVNSFETDHIGRYLGQSTGLIKAINDTEEKAYKHILLINNTTKQIELSK